MRLGIYGFIAVAVVGFFAYDHYDKKANFSAGRWTHQRRQRAMLYGEGRARPSSPRRR